MFPVHKSIWGGIHREWKHPDKGVFTSRALKRKYPFSEQDTVVWCRAPKLDVPIAKVSKKSSLPFEDAGTLQDPLDKKQDLFLKKTWEASAASFKPNIAATCVARSLSVWLEQLSNFSGSAKSAQQNPKDPGHTRLAAEQGEILLSTIPDQTVSGHYHKFKRTKISPTAKNRETPKHP